MSYYADNDEIANRWYDGESIPDDDIITSGSLTGIKNACNRKINSHLRVTTNITDTYGVCKDVFIELFGRYLDTDLVNELTESERRRLDDYHKAAPIVIMSKGQDVTGQ